MNIDSLQFTRRLRKEFPRIRLLKPLVSSWGRDTALTCPVTRLVLAISFHVAVCLGQVTTMNMPIHIYIHTTLHTRYPCVQISQTSPAFSMAFPLQKTFLCSNGQSFPCSNGRSTSTLLAFDLKFQRLNKPFILRVGSMQIRNSSKEHPRVSSAAVLPPVPRSIHDIPNGDHILGFGANLAEDHPGYRDEEYKRRRSCIADLAKKHKIGEPIPEINYTTEEAHIWAEVLTKLSELYPSHACKEYLESFPLFNFSPNKIPQLEELSQVLQHYTGWKIRPVAGLLHPRQFLNGLAFKTFHSTQYIRHTSNPMYTPEPDICHEILGHMPMLVHPEFADLAQVIGLASLGASDKEIWHLTKLYWYTVEFGTIEENKEVKAFGAGILSSFGELQHMKSSKPTFQNLDPFAQLPKMSYKDGFQNMYFLCQSFSDTTEKLRSYARTIHSGSH